MMPVFFAFAVSLLGVGLFKLFALPLPWLLGPLFASLIAALVGVPLRGVKPLNDSMRTILGVAVGATLTPAVLVSIPTLWPTLILIPVMIVVIGAVGIPYFRRVWGYDFATAY